MEDLLVKTFWLQKKFHITDRTLDGVSLCGVTRKRMPKPEVWYKPTELFGVYPPKILCRRCYRNLMRTLDLIENMTSKETK